MNTGKNAGWGQSVMPYLKFVVCCIVLLANQSEARPTDITIKLIWAAETGLYSSNLDLYVTEPNGETASPSNPSTALGGELTASGTSPELYELGTGKEGDYRIAVKYPEYDTEDAHEASVTVILYEGTSAESVTTFGPETLGQTVGSTWHVGEFRFPGGEIISEGAEIIIKLLWAAEAGVYTSISNLDLYVTEPNGETASPSNSSTSSGGELDGSDTGPELYQMETAGEGNYTISVKYPGYDTENPQEALVNVLIYEGMSRGSVITFGPETLGRTVGPTWHAGTFNFPSGVVTSEGGSSGVGCFIATAAYGSPLAEEVCYLRIFRDRYLAGKKGGRLLLGIYYYLSPPVADFIRNHPFLKMSVRVALKPLLFLSKFIAERD